VEADRHQQLNAAKFRALLKASRGLDLVDVVADPHFNRGVAFSFNGSAWIYITDEPSRALGACLAWVESKLADAREVNIIVDQDAGIVARRARKFNRRINVFVVDDREIKEAPPLEFPVPVEAKGSHLELRSLIEEGGAQVVVEHGVVVGEVYGLEVCRVLDDGASPRLEVGVGTHDREAFGLLHGHLPTVDAVRQHVSAVRPHRESPIGTHPLNRLAASRLIRARVIASPELVGAEFLEVAEPPVPRTNLKDEVPCVAKGRAISGRRLVVVFAHGIDLEVVPFAVDAREWIQPDAELVIVVPKRDLHTLTEKIASSVLGGCSVVGVSV
jgi:hypothetical protein